MRRYGRSWFRGKRVVVIGLAKSGLAAACLLWELGAQVTVNDRQEAWQIPPEAKRKLEERGIVCRWGGHPDDLIDPGVDLVVKNPGIPYRILPIQQAIKYQIPVITEVELGWQWTVSPMIGITGSNGKTTTTSLIGEMFRQAERKAHVVGNIGMVMSEVAFHSRPDETLVVELSSFQLLGTLDFRPDVAVLTNIYPAHLDYHGTLEEYTRAKLKLFANQRADDVAVLNADQEVSGRLAPEIGAQIWWFSIRSAVSPGVYLEDGEVYWQPPDGQRRRLFSRSDVALKGDHNLENLLAASCAAVAYGLPVEAVRRVASTFTGVEHRLEFVRKVNGVAYYNDSKATNTTAAITALRSFKEGITWIAGGLDRGHSFDEMIPIVQKHVKRVIAYGETSERIIEMCRRAGVSLCSTVGSVEEAVDLAAVITPPGDVVLLSPACASWDMYRSFEERGNIFKQAVHKL
jgi:UDP-N-acetylmuramoylalanine--D-glutamate ligase